MLLLKQSADLINYLEKQHSKGFSVGFLPTMGALHLGHISLVEKAKKSCDVVVCSIFVNPTQFNNPTDLAKYPRPFSKDVEMLISAECDVLFHPEVGEMYFEHEVPKQINLAGLAKVYEGFYRPGHFDGVVTIVSKLLEIVNPNELFIGQKDLQQCAVINKLVLEKGFKSSVVICPTVREKDGLALSSRNLLLSDNERTAALKISKALFFIKEEIQNYSLDELLFKAQDILIDDLITIEYIDVVNRNTFIKSSSVTDNGKAVVVAVFCGKVRLIDNLFLD